MLTKPRARYPVKILLADILIFGAFFFLMQTPERQKTAINNNNNNVHLSCAHQCPERSHDTY